MSEKLPRTSTSEWKEIRRETVLRDQGRCTVCGSTLAKGAVELHVHHLQEVSDGGGDEKENLATVCRGCHQDIHGWAIRGEGESPVVITDRDKKALDVLGVDRANPMLIREETGLDKGAVNTVLVKLTRDGLAKRVVPGLYEITDEGRGYC